MASSRTRSPSSFLDPRARDFFEDWQERADQGVYFLRAAAARYPGNRELAALVAQLSAGSPEFAAAWNSHGVRFQQVGTRAINHPVLGLLALDFQGLRPIGHDRLRLVVYTADPGSPTAAGLKRLAGQVG